MSPGSLSISLVRALAITVGLLATSAVAFGEPFRIENWKVTGRPLDAQAIQAGGGTWLAVISVDGMPPNERRYVTLGRLDGPAPRQVEIPQTVVAVDFEELDASPGPEILTIERGRLRVLGVDGRVLLTVPLRPSLPLPPRTRQLSRLDVLGDWDGLGRHEALLPDLDGLRVVPLSDPDAAHGLEMAVTHISEGIGGGPSQRSFWISELSWPRVVLGDLDGDGLPELWASDRFGLAWFQRGPKGLAAEPSAIQPFPPFSFDEELRHKANLLRAEATDFDSDGLSDLLVLRTAGTVSASRTHVALHRNRGGMIDASARPDAELSVEGGFGLIEPVDLDGDGSAELLQLEVDFGIMQMIRIFTGGRADVRLRLHSVRAEGEGLKLAETWSETITVPFDTAKSRVGTLLPKTQGDWNGDGLLDLVYGDGDQLAIRLSERGPQGMRFSKVHNANVKPTEGGLAADLDGDGFSELVLWNPLDRKGRVRILRNQRTLPGSPPQIGPRD